VIFPKMERLIALDVETTGLRISEGHRIIEVGAVEGTDPADIGPVFFACREVA